MEVMIGVEAAALISEIPEFEELMNSDCNVIERFGTIYIYRDLQAAINACDVLIDAELYENMHTFIKHANGKPGECFFDCGFSDGSNVYLFKDLLFAFYLEGDDELQVKMAKEQIEEHLVFETVLHGVNVLYAEKQFDSLVKGIARAYNCEARFLDLDK
ncbi:hypothetical protein [Mesobacillus foraminis]|uniref:Uncharacterized protein n=1 Tax=Mesobacillus foraminis TaxID=279826 RepID=A0A4R2B815_9BACI|nr:hypothetical protein [Mesobacillus foraminis]TCN22878.1 hypothetical protein EV146_10931 [Mesobacillus foraminis]